jgi:hypothetical protein
MEERAAVTVALGRLERGSREAADWLLHWSLAARRAGTAPPPALRPRLVSALATAFQQETEQCGRGPLLPFLSRGRGLLYLLALELAAGEDSALALAALELAGRVLKERGEGGQQEEDGYCSLVPEAEFTAPPARGRRGRRAVGRGRQRHRQRSTLSAFPEVALEAERLAFVGQCENLAEWEPELLGSSDEEAGPVAGRGRRLEARPAHGFEYYDRGDLASDEATKQRLAGPARLAPLPAAPAPEPATGRAVLLLLLHLADHGSRPGATVRPAEPLARTLALLLELGPGGEPREARLLLRLLLNCLAALRVRPDLLAPLLPGLVQRLGSLLAGWVAPARHALFHALNAFNITCHSII